MFVVEMEAGPESDFSRRIELNKLSWYYQLYLFPMLRKMEHDDQMGRKVSLYLILGFVLIGFIADPVAAVIESAQMENGDISIINDMCGKDWHYYDHSTGVWTSGRIGEPQSRYIYTPTMVYKLNPVKKYTIPNGNADSLITPVQIINNSHSLFPKTNFANSYSNSLLPQTNPLPDW